MAMKAKETGARHHHREKSSSAPSTPRTHGRGDSTTDYPPSTPQTHGRRDSTDCELPMLPLKPMPNYLKPTISSGQEICPYANKKPSLETPAMAAKRLMRRRSIDKVPLHPSSQPHKARTLTNTTAVQKEKTSPAAPLPKPLSVKTPKSVKTAPPTKVAKVPAVAKPRPKEKVLGVDGGSKAKKNDHVNSPRDVHMTVARAQKVARDDDGDSADHYEGSGESLAGSERGPRRIKLRTGREGEATEVENESVTVKKQDGNGKKESPPSKQVLEEATSKLAGTRRNKVAALVGAFETVISLQEPEPGQQHQEAMEKEEAAVDCKGGVVAEEAHGWDESENNVVAKEAHGWEESENNVVAKETEDGEKSAVAMLVVEAKEEVEGGKAAESLEPVEVMATAEKAVEDDGMTKEANENSEEVSPKLVDGATGSL